MATNTLLNIIYWSFFLKEHLCCFLFMHAVTFDQNMTPLSYLMLSIWIKGLFES